MKQLRNPIWIFLTLTLPQILLIGLYTSAFQIIKTLLKPENIEWWINLGIPLGCLLALSTLYAGWLIIRKRPIHSVFGLLVLLTYIPLLVVFVFYGETIIPWTIPRWMISQGDLMLYPFTFIMPCLAYGLFLTVDWLTPNPKEKKAWISFLISCAIPLSWYMMAVLGRKGLFDNLHHFPKEVFAVVLIVSTVIFLAFLIRTIYILLSKRNKFWTTYKYFWLVPIALIFPLLGLALNNGLIEKFPSHAHFIFGDFSHPLFYTLAIVNALLLLTPTITLPKGRLVMFFARSFTYAYTVYFFLVFLPFLPISIIATIAIGVGFLLLAPLLLMMVQTKYLYEDYQALSLLFNKKVLLLGAMVAFLCIPTAIVIKYQLHKRQLNKALDYVYAPSLDGKSSKDIDPNVVSKVLNVVKSYKENNNNRFDMGNKNIPYLTAFYKWMVLDNLTLSNNKIQLLEKIFVGVSHTNSRNFRTFPNSGNVLLDDMIATSTFDEEKEYWTSTIDLSLTNMKSGMQEYSTTFTLPNGAWLSDYYLWVGDKKEKGLLTEKKAALWVYNQIVSRRKDPGILTYQKGNNIDFKVFPFTSQETRKTGFEIIHKEPFAFSLDNKQVQLGDSMQIAHLQRPTTIAASNITFVPSEFKRQLATVKRKPYYHFIMDCSYTVDEETIEGYNQSISQLLDKNLIEENKDIKITLTNFTSTTVDYQNNWEQTAKSFPKQGGFLVEQAIKEIWFQHYQTPTDQYPVIVILSPRLNNMIIPTGFDDLLFTYPDSKLFYSVTKTGQGRLQAHDFTTPTTIAIEQVTEKILPKPVVAYPNLQKPSHYLTSDRAGSIIMEKQLTTFPTSTALAKDWTSGLRLQTMWQYLKLHPNETDQYWLSIIQQSFQSKIMTPLTAYMVVENEAQKAALLKKQQQILAAKFSLDAGEEPPRGMSEPPLWLLFLLFVSFSAILRYYKPRFIS